MVDLVALSSRKHIENMDSEALKTSEEGSKLFENIDKALGINSLKNQVQHQAFGKAMISVATSPDAINAVDGTTHQANLAYKSSNLDSLEEMMQYQLHRSEIILKKIKEHPQAENIFKRVDELCNETSTSNIVELMTTKFDNPEVSSTINDLNTVINHDADLKKDFEEFQKEYSNFSSTQLSYNKELVDQLENDQLDHSERSALLQHASDRVNIINDDYSKILEDGKSVPLYNQSKDHDSPLILEQHESLISNKEVTYQKFKEITVEQNVQNNNQNQLSM